MCLLTSSRNHLLPEHHLRHFDVQFLHAISAISHLRAINGMAALPPASRLQGHSTRKLQLLDPNSPSVFDVDTVCTTMTVSALHLHLIAPVLDVADPAISRLFVIQPSEASLNVNDDHAPSKPD
jgi:hypothetical protein